MAGIAIPDNLRPAFAAIAKYHFWILAALAPLLLLPLLFVGAGGLKARITAQRGTIEAKLGQARAVTSQRPHPNESWRTAIDADVAEVDRETLVEWRRFWHSQAGLRVWPALLGDSFLADVARLQPGGKLDRNSLVRYQNDVPRLVRSLPGRMGVQDAMTGQQGDLGPGGTPLPGTAGAVLTPVLVWNPSSQKKLYDSFVWQRVPSTTQVLLAQEELQVYGLFCDLLAGFVKGATGGHDSPLPIVEELAVGFPANVDGGQPQQGGRIVIPAAAGAGSTEGVMMDAGGGAPTETPWHPRFTGGAGGPPPAAPGEQPARSPDDDFRGWIYVDFAGKPLSAAELAANPALRMVHLMPFVLRVVVDQRQLDRLLATLAQSSIPIDVRQVRVNPGAAIAQGPQDNSARGQTGRRPNDLIVELRGSVALATPPVVEAPATEATP
jgi:hypothetical protein